MATTSARPAAANDRASSSFALWGVVWLVCLITLAGLSIRAAGNEPGSFDLRVLERVRDLPSALEPLFKLEAWLGQAGPLALATVALAAWLQLRRARLEALLALGAFLPFAATILVKHIVQETPPYLTHPAHYHNVFSSNYAFPSGHVVGFTILGVLAVAFAGRLLPSPPRAGLLRLGCTAAITTVGIARIYDKTHFPTDVAAGYLLALLYLIPALVLYQRLGGRRNPDG